MWYPIPIIIMIFSVHLVYKEYENNKYSRYDKKVRQSLKQCAKKYQGVFYDNSIIDNTTLSQTITAILLTRKALYLISLIPYEGTIKGQMTDQYWTASYETKNPGFNHRHFNSRKKTLKFRNPYHQGISESIVSIQNALKQYKVPPIFHLVVFPQCTNLMHLNNVQTAVHTNKIKQWIIDKEAKLTPTLTMTEQCIIIKLLNIDIAHVKTRKTGALTSTDLTSNY